MFEELEEILFLRLIKLIFLTLGIIISPLLFKTSKVKASSFGAEIFCTMRDGGNDHESSWDAAYSYICLLYTSPSPRDPWKSRMPSSA